MSFPTLFLALQQNGNRINANVIIELSAHAANGARYIGRKLKFRIGEWANLGLGIGHLDLAFAATSRTSQNKLAMPAAITMKKGSPLSPLNKQIPNPVPQKKQKKSLIWHWPSSLPDGDTKCALTLKRLARA